MEMKSFIQILVILGICFGIYKLARCISKKRNNRPLWRPKDESYLKDVLGRIYSAASLEHLQRLAAEEIKFYSRYRYLFRVAKEEKQQEIAQTTPAMSFEEKESRTRKRWFVSFFINCFIIGMMYLITMLYINTPPADAFYLWLSVIIGSVLIGLGMWWTYYCAYLKKGTFLLSMIAFGSPFQMVFSHMRDGDGLAVSLLTLITEIALFGFFWYSSFLLRKINSEVRARRQLAGLKQIM